MKFQQNKSAIIDYRFYKLYNLIYARLVIIFIISQAYSFIITQILLIALHIFILLIFSLITSSILIFSFFHLMMIWLFIK